MTTSRMLVSLLPCLISVGFAHAACGDECKDELQGRWNLEKIVLEGKAFPEQVKGAQFKFDKNTLTIVPPDDLGEGFPKQTLRFTVNPQTNPKSIDTTNLDGAEKGWTSAGIYKIEGDTLTVCIPTARGLGRPMNFEPKEGSKLAVYTLQRAKPPRPPERSKPKAN